MTGGASGIGLATARELARRGARLVLGDVEAPALERAVGALRAEGFEAHGVVCDVRRLDEVEKLGSASQLAVETELVQARDTGPALVDEAVEWGADLIVMGLPYKRRFGEFNLGKTVPYVLKNATCRVMLFREHREHREDGT